MTGKVPRSYACLNGHSAAVYDTAWNPFNDNILATGSDDTTVKLWTIPDGGLTENVRDAAVTLTGHGKPVALLQWHPTAGNVLASAAKDPSVKIWDVENAAAKITLEGFGGLIQDLAWNYDGSLLITSTKDKLAKIHDVRSGSVVSEWTPHEGGKAFKTLFLGERGQILTVGFTKQSKREFKLWDAKNTTTPLATQEVDQAAGVMLPFYDDDTRMLYLTGKGDGNIRYYEFTDEAPYVYLLSEHRTNVSTKGCDMLPKRTCNVMKCEVARFLKLTSDSAEPISFIVPRKSEAFQEDIYPDTVANTPSLDAASWFNGKTVVPKKMSLDPHKGGASAHAAPATFKPTVTSTPTTATSTVSSPSPANTGAAAAASSAASIAAAVAKAEEASNARIAQLEAKIASLTNELAAAKLSSESAPVSGSDGACCEATKNELSTAQARIVELEAANAKLKKAVAALSAE
jgi:coronin-1B/1C/6